MKTSKLHTFLQAWRIEIFCVLLAMASITSVWMVALVQQVRDSGVTCFSIMWLELPPSQECLAATLQKVADHYSMAAVHKNLLVDFAFMPAIYGLVAFWLLLIRRGDIKKWWRNLLLLLAALQILPWIFDITENLYLLKALQQPAYQLDMEVGTFKMMVKAKFAISVGGAAVALLVCVLKAVKKGWVYK